MIRTGRFSSCVGVRMYYVWVVNGVGYVCNTRNKVRYARKYCISDARKTHKVHDKHNACNRHTFS